jgi:uncharacterized repeat protein (TIGR03943 family)
LYYYINQRFFTLVLLAGAGFLLLGIVVLVYRDDHAHGHAHTDHQHSHPDGGLPRWSLAVVAIPLLLGFLIPSKPLDANVVQSRGISNDTLWTPTGTNVQVELNQPADQRTILDWIRAFNFSDNPAEFSGETADVIGFVYHDPRLPEDQFLVGRLTITCCVADAFAIGMVVEWPGAIEMVENTWVHVRGEVDVLEIGGKTLPLIRAESVKDTDPPAQPYLFP